MVRDGVMPHSVLTGQAQEEFSKYSEGGHIIHNHHNKTPHSDGDIMSVKIAKLNSVSAVNPDNDYILDFSKIEEDNRNVIFDEIILKLKGWRIDFEKNRITKEQRDDNIREYCRNIAKKYGIIYQIGY